MEGESHAFRGASLMNQFFLRYAQRAKTIELKVRKNFMNELNVAKQVVAIEIGKNGKSFTKNKELNTMIAQLYSVPDKLINGFVQRLNALQSKIETDSLARVKKDFAAANTHLANQALTVDGHGCT